MSGNWVWPELPMSRLNTLLNTTNTWLVINITGVDQLDTAGAYILQKIQKNNPSCQFKANATQTSILTLIQTNTVDNTSSTIRLNAYDNVYLIGKKTTDHLRKSLNLIAFIGETFLSYWITNKVPLNMRLKLVTDIIIDVGIKAIPIVSLLCFLIGIVLCYQIGGELKQYGANIFIVDILGIAILREFAPLITAIIVAGRTASSFTAEIGAMKAQQELDALKTFGISPIKRLVLPRIIGMIIALPLLVMVADILSCLGGMIMAKATLAVEYQAFIDRFFIAISFKTYLAGLIKAPVFAIIIAFVGCYLGMSVRNDTVSIGQETTKSVVYSIFMIIIADALFSIFYSSIGI